MKIITVTPFPLMERVIERFPFVKEAKDHVVFAYGEDLYNPGGGPISPDVMIHEAVHSVQQHKDKDAWWERYLKDDAFLLSQEVQAYRTQYQFFRSFNKDRNTQARFLVKLATDLSSPLYGSLCSHSDALRLIRNAAGL